MHTRASHQRVSPFKNHGTPDIGCTIYTRLKSTDLVHTPRKTESSQIMIISNYHYNDVVYLIRLALPYTIETD